MSYIDAQGKEHALVIAEHDAVVTDEQYGFDRQIVAGQPVPPELEEAYKKAPKKQASSSAKSGDKGADATRRDEHQAARKSSSSD